MQLICCLLLSLGQEFEYSNENPKQSALRAR